MRHELELMELVDRYLHNELNTDERTAFTERLRSNAELRQWVQDQRALHAGMERLVLRSAVDKAYRSHRFGKWMSWIGGAALIALLAACHLVSSSSEHEHTNVAPMQVPTDTSSLVVEGTASGTSIQSDIRPDSIRPVRDTIIRTEVRVVHKPVIAQETTSISEKEPDTGIVTLRSARSEEMPSYPGGFSAMHTFLQRNIRYPDTILSRTDAVIIEFLVDVDGSIQEAQVAKGIGKCFDEEALRVVRRMPKWNPAQENGKPVKARIEVPIRFTAVAVESTHPSISSPIDGPKWSDR